jgi:hypothetical protein
MGLAMRGVAREPTGAKTDGTDGTHETNGFAAARAELGGGRLIILLAPELITDLLITRLGGSQRLDRSSGPGRLSTKRSASACLRSGGTLQLVRLVSPNHQTKLFHRNYYRGYALEVPLNLGSEQPAVIGFAVGIRP